MRRRNIALISLILAAALSRLAAQSPSPGGLSRITEISQDDAGSILQRVSGLRTAPVVLDPARLAGKVVIMPDASRMDLSRIAGMMKARVMGINADTDRLLRAGKAVIDAKKVVSLILETEDAFILTEGLEVQVKDPAAFAAASAEFASYLRGAQRTPRYASLGAKDKAKVDAYYAKISSKRGVTILGSSAREFFDLSAEGKGTFEVIETFMVPKTARSLRPPRLASAGEPSPMPTASPLPASIMRSEGSTSISKNFMNGFTFDAGAEWEKRWRFGVGLFRMSVKASMTAGLRIPLRVKVRDAGPTTVEVIRIEDTAVPVRAWVGIEPFDAPTALYEGLGIRDSHEGSEGKELALGGSVDVGYKLSLFGEDIIYREISPIVDFNYGFDFVPPLSDVAVARFPIPMETTRTGLSAGGVKGGLELGVKLSTRGSATMDARWAMGGASNPFRSLTFTSPLDQQLSWTLPRLDSPAMSAGQTRTREYRLEFRDLRYTLTGALTPCARISASVDLEIFSRGFHTDWYDMDSFSVSLGSITLGNHAGTPASWTPTIGTKSFSKENTRDPSLAGDVSLSIRSSSGGERQYAVQDDYNGMLKESDRPGRVTLEYIRPSMASALAGTPRYVVFFSSAKGRYLVDRGVSELAGSVMGIGAAGREQAPPDGWQPRRDKEVFRIEMVPNGYILVSEAFGDVRYVRTAYGDIIGAHVSSRADASVFTVTPLR